MLTLLVVMLATAAPSPHKIKLAVLDTEDVSGTEAPRARLLTQVLVGELPKQGRFEVISSAEIKNVLGFERQKQLLGCSEDSQCLAELGGALGVDYLISGQLGRLGKRYRLDLRLIDARRSRVVASEGDFLEGGEDGLGDATIAMLKRLLQQGGLREQVVASGSTPVATEPAGGLSASSPSTSHAGAFVVAGTAVVLAGAATVMTLRAHDQFAKDQECYRNHLPLCAATHSPDTSAHVADALWAGTAIAAGVSAYLFLRPAESSGAGGEVGVAGRF